MKNFSDWLHRFSTGQMALIALAVFILFMAFVMPGQAAQANKIGAQAGSPDMSFFYSANDLYRMAEAYGPQGRQAYIRARFTFDVIWPLVYAFFLVTSVSWLFRKAFGPASPWQVANLVPVLGAGFDYLENIATSLVMARYPATTPLVDMLASLLTIIKWTLVNGSFVLLLLGAALALWNGLKNRQAR